MKRYIMGAIISCIMLLIMESNFIYIQAATPVKFEVNTTEINEENKISTYVSVSDNPGYAGMQFELIYDEDILNVSYIKEITSNISMVPIITDKNGKITYIVAEAENHNGNGEILEIEFEIKDINKFENSEIIIEELMVVDENINILDVGLIINEIEKDEEQDSSKDIIEKFTESEEESSDSSDTVSNSTDIKESEEQPENTQKPEDISEKSDEQPVTEFSREAVIIIALIGEAIIIVFIFVRGYVKRKG